jgi:integrase
VFVDGVEERDEYFLATGVHARRVSADLDELRALRLKRTGGSVFSRKGSSRFLQIKYPDGKGGWRYESARTQNRQDAEALLRLRAYEASAGSLPGTATFEQIIERLLDAAKIGGFKSVARMARAGKALRAKFEGCRAEQIDNGALREFVKERLQQVAPDTVNYEVSIAKRAYRLARADGLLRSIPEFPRIKNLRVRRGFVEAKEWRALRERLQPDFRDAADFALLTGAREMETLSIGRADVELDARVIHLRHTKTGVPRAIPFGQYPALAELVERRLAIQRALEREGIISPWFFCFSRAAVRRPAGSPLFERANRKSGERGLCKASQRMARRRCRCRSSRPVVSRPATDRRANFRAFDSG